MLPLANSFNINKYKQKIKLINIDKLKELYKNSISIRFKNGNKNYCLYKNPLFGLVDA